MIFYKGTYAGTKKKIYVPYQAAEGWKFKICDKILLGGMKSKRLI